MKIKVTQEHINRGIRRDDSKCAIALALKDHGFRNPCVTDTNVCLDKNLRCYRDLSKRAMKFVEKYDSNKPVKPFTFVIKGI